MISTVKWRAGITLSVGYVKCSKHFFILTLPNNSRKTLSVTLMVMLESHQMICKDSSTIKWPIWGGACFHISQNFVIFLWYYILFPKFLPRFGLTTILLYYYNILYFVIWRNSEQDKLGEIRWIGVLIRSRETKVKENASL
jgi:hypothetical protein